MASLETATPAPAARQTARHKWFPLLVLAAAIGGWIRLAMDSQYQTVVHVLLLLVTVILVGGWYLFHGAQCRQVRRAIVWPIWLAIVLLFIIFRPVYNGDMGVYSWRLRFASRADQRMAPLAAANEAGDWATTPHDYPRFLGTGFWPEVEGVDLETDWSAHPPVEMWRREIGPGWSSFSIVGNYAVTQEQRGPNEMVTCYRLDNGEPVWTHTDKVRFDPADVLGGLGDVGPRATPTLHNGKVFTQGGTGLVNCLDAVTGAKIWSCDTAQQFGAAVTVWGKSGSPLIVGDTVVISVGAPHQPTSDDASSLVAFDLDTGDVRWAAGQRQASYASPILAEIAGEPQIVVVNESYLTSHRPSDGKVLWEYVWARENDREASCAQPIPLPDDRLLLTKGYGVGSSLIKIRRDDDGQLVAEPLWNPPIKRVMKNKFSNVVVRGRYAYGLDDVLLECLEWETGKVKWKKRRSPEFGHGQILLVGDSILVLSEAGELALVEVSPERFHELSSTQVLDDANVTWNNPAFAPPFLVVRNAREAACYRLPVAGTLRAP